MVVFWFYLCVRSPTSWRETSVSPLWTPVFGIKVAWIAGWNGSQSDSTFTDGLGIVLLTRRARDGKRTLWKDSRRHGPAPPSDDKFPNQAHGVFGVFCAAADAIPG